MPEKRPVPDLQNDTLVEMGKAQLDNFNAAAEIGTVFMESLGKWNAEIVQFVANRIKEDVRTQREILHCQDIDELRHIQTRFFSDAVSQYSAEAGRLMKMSADAMTETVKRAKV